MFAPEGYLRWQDMIEWLDDWANRILLAHMLETEGRSIDLAFDEGASGATSLLRYRQHKAAEFGRGIDFAREFGLLRRQHDFEGTIILSVLLSKALLTFDTLLCSTDGKLLRAPEQTLIHMDRLDWCYWCWPIRDTTEFSKYFEYFDAGNFEGHNIVQRFCFIDESSGTISSKNNSEVEYARASHQIASKSEHDAIISKLVTPFIGWSICWNLDQFQKYSPIETVDILGGFQPEWEIPRQNSFHQPAQIGKKRGAKPTGAREEYYRRYPDGKPSEVSYDAISMELEEAGYPISARQIANYERDRR